MKFIVRADVPERRPPLDTTQCVLCSEDPRWCA